MVATNEEINWDSDPDDEIIRKLVESGYPQRAAQAILDAGRGAPGTGPDVGRPVR